MEEGTSLGMSARKKKLGLFLSVYVDDIIMVGKTQNPHENVEVSTSRKLILTFQRQS